MDNDQMAYEPLRVIDTHAGGDVSRIVVGGVRPLPGETVREKMEYLQREADGLRRFLLTEPVGAPEMSVDLVVPASNPGAEAGYIIMEVMGYPIYSGSNTMCTATALMEIGAAPKPEGLSSLTLEAPAGPVRVDARVEGGVVEAITCEGLPSYIDTYRDAVSVPGVGDVTYSVAYSGGFYALVDAAELGFSLAPEEERDLAARAGAIVEAIRAARRFVHPTLGDVGPLPFLHFMGPLGDRGGGRYRSRSATYVHPGVICRSTTGTGTSARLALHRREGALGPGDTLETVSLRDTSFTGEILATRMEGEREVVENAITGKSYVLSRSEIFVRCDDPLIACHDLTPVLEPRGA